MIVFNVQVFLVFWDDDALKLAESHLKSLDCLKNILTRSDPCPISDLTHRKGPVIPTTKNDMRIRETGNWLRTCFDLVQICLIFREAMQHDQHAGVITRWVLLVFHIAWHKAEIHGNYGCFSTPYTHSIHWCFYFIGLLREFILFLFVPSPCGISVPETIPRGAEMKDSTARGLHNLQ